MGFYRWKVVRFDSGRELLRLPEDERPNPVEPKGRTTNHTTTVQDMLGSIPTGWTFYDDKIPEWYEEYTREKRAEEANRVQAPIISPGDEISAGRSQDNITSAETSLAALQIEDVVPIASVEE